MALADHPRISLATRQQVKQLAQQMGYLRPRDTAVGSTPRRSARDSRRIGMMLIGGDLHDDVNLAALNALNSVVAMHGLRLEISAIDEMLDNQAIIRHISRFMVGLDGLIISGPIDEPILVRLERCGPPILILGHMMQSPHDLPRKTGYVVAYDEEAMGRFATARLLLSGHRRVAFICEMAPDGMSHARWLSGYRLAHLDLNYPVDRELVQITGQVHRGAEPAVDVLQRLQQPPTAYVVPDARIAASLVTVLRLRGLKIDRQQLIASGIREVVPRYRLEGYPMVVPDTHRHLAVAVEHLCQLMDQPERRRIGAVDVVLPFLTMNFT